MCLWARGSPGHGFKFSTLVGDMLAELAVDGRTEQAIERFRLEQVRRGGVVDSRTGD